MGYIIEKLIDTMKIPSRNLIYLPLVFIMSGCSDGKYHPYNNGTSLYNVTQKCVGVQKFTAIVLPDGNDDLDQFGCSYLSNMRNQIANKQDIYTPSKIGKQNPIATMGSIENYQKGEITPLRDTSLKPGNKQNGS